MGLLSEGGDVGGVLWQFARTGVGLDESEEKGKSGFGHLAVVEAPEFMEVGVGVADELHEAPEIGVLLVAPEEFLFAIAGDEQERRCVFADVVDGGEVVDEGGGVGDSALGPDGVVGDGLGAEGDQAGELVGVDVMGSEPSSVQSEHGGEVASG